MQPNNPFAKYGGHEVTATPIAPPVAPQQDPFAKYGGKEITPPVPVPEVKKKRSVKDMAREGADILWSAAKSIPKQIVEDVKYGAPSRFLKGVAGAADIGFYLPRKGLEKLTGKEFKTSSELFPEKPEEKKNHTQSLTNALNKGSEFAGSMVGAGVVGRGLQVVNQLAKIPYITKPIEKVISLFGPAKTTQELGHLAKIGAGSGVLASSVHDASQGKIPEWAADVGASIAYPIATNKLLKRQYGVKEMPKLSKSEEHVVELLRDKLSPDEFKSLLPRLSAYESPIEGFKPLTAEVVQNPYVSFQQRASKALGAELEHSGDKLRNTLRGGETEHGIESVLQSLGGRKAANEEKARTVHEALKNKLALQTAPYQSDNKERTGKHVRAAVQDALDIVQTAKTKGGKQLYQKELPKNKTKLSTPEAFKYIEEQLNEIGVQGPARNYLLKYKKALLPEKGNRSLEKMPKDLQYLKEGAEEIVQAAYKTPSEISNILTDIEKNAKAAKVSAPDATSILREFKKKLEIDAKAVKQIAETKAAYKKLAKPVSAITKQKGLEKVLKKDDWKPNPDTDAAQIPELFLTGDTAYANARALRKILRKDPARQEAVNNYLHEDFLKKVTDANGNIKKSKVHTYFKNTPGARILNPKFEKDARKYVKTQEAITHVAAKEKKPHTVEEEIAFESVFGKGKEAIASYNVPGGLFRGDNPPKRIESIVKSLGKDKTAQSGLKRALNDHLLSVINVRYPGKENVRLLKNARHSLKHVYSPDELKQYDAMTNAISNRYKSQDLASIIGPGTSQNLESRAELGPQLMRKGVRKTLNALSKGYRAGDVLEAGTTAVNQDIKEHTIKAMEDFLKSPDYAKDILRNKQAHDLYAKNKQRFRTQIAPLTSMLIGDKDKKK